jgi:serine/threonine-protein kinase
MSVVWRARDEVLVRQVAVKVLSGRYADDPAARRRIRDEARTAAALSHPNIAQVYDFGESTDDGVCTPYVVMELVAGPTLEQQAAAGPLPPALAFRICAQVAAALAAAHAGGLVHRDVKPANVIVAAAGAKVVDFGIAAAASPPRSPESDGELLGTPAYVAPERITSDVVEPASDVYSLGVLLYKLLAGRLPWGAGTAVEQLTSHVLTDPAPLPALPGVPDAVAELCMACLAKDPAVRPDAGTVAARLAEAAGLRTVEDDAAHTLAPAAADGGPSTVLVRGTDATQPTPDRRRRLAVIATAGAAVSAAALSWLLAGASPSTPGTPQAAAGESRPAASGGASPLSSNPGPSRPGQPPNVDGSATPAAAGTQSALADSGPLTPPAATSPPTDGTATPPTTFTSEGGTIHAACMSSDRAQLLSWAPARSYRVARVESGPAPAAAVAFRHGTILVETTVICSDGVASAAISRSQR